MVNPKRVFSSLFLLSAVVFVLSLNACKTPPQAPSTVVNLPVGNDESPVFDLSLSSQKAPDGSLLMLKISPRIELDRKKVTVKFEDSEYPVIEVPGSKELISLLVVPFNSKPRSSKVVLGWHDGTHLKSAEVSLEVVDGNYKSETLKVDEKKVSPPKKVMKRIAREQKKIGAIYRGVTPEKLWSGSFDFPLDTELTSPFGNKRVYNGHMNGFHQGLDFRARTPLPIKAPEGAKVALAEDLYFTGDTVILDHGFGLYTIYGHMSRMDVKVGDVITKGQIIGLTGASGRATGPHLHWGAVLMKQKFNPLDLKRVLK